MIILSNFQRKFSKSALGLSLSLFEKRDKVLIGVVLFIQVFLGVLDLAGIAVIGIIGSLAISGVSAGAIGDRVRVVLKSLSLDESSLQTQIAILGVIAACFLVAKSLISLYFSRRTLLFLSRRSALLSGGLLRKYFGRNLEIVRNRSSQEVIYACTAGVNAVMIGVVGAWVNLLSDIALLTILGFGLLAVDSLIAFLVAITFTLVAYLLHQQMHQRVEDIGRYQATKSVEVSQKVQEALLSFREIFVRDRRGYYARSIGRLQLEMADRQALMSFMAFIGKYVFEITLVISGVFISAIQFATQPAGRAIAILSIFLAASARIMPAVLRIQQGLMRIRNNMGASIPTIDLISELRNSPDVTDSPDVFPTSHEGFVGRVELSNVSFSYATESNFRIVELNIDVQDGEFIALVGASGSGKTTTVDLLLGILEPQTGEVRISGLPPKEAVSCWPGAISYVSQDSSLFDGSIRRNLALGFEEDGIDDAYYWSALEKADMADFVRNLPGQLDAYVGERGMKLSGGQRQRIAIARAFMTAPKLLILDEATSALDSETEASITESLHEIKGSLTIITIAHRLSTILKADRIYFFKDGNVLGVGSFSRLRETLPDFRKQAELMGL